MKDFTYSYPVNVYFGTDAAKKAISQEIGKYGKNVMLAYGGGSVKKSGIYDAVVSMLKEAGKEVTDFPGIMPNPTYAKVQEGAALAKEKMLISFSLSAAVPSSTAVRSSPHRQRQTRISGRWNLPTMYSRQNSFRWALL